MKRNLYLILALLFVGSMQLSAQQMAVAFNNGGELMLEEDYDYTKCKITFSNGEMLFQVNEKVIETIEIKDISRIYFYDVDASVDAMQGDEPATYSAAREELVVHAQPGAVVTVYHVSGAKVLSHIQTIANTSISVAHLPAGAYVVVIGGKTLKFVKP